MSRGARAAMAGAWLLLAPVAARAHLAETGLGPFVDGASHLLLSFDDLLPVIAMALLAGLNGKSAAKGALVALPSAWMAGGVAGFVTGTAFLPAGITSVSLLALGILVAADRRLAPAAVAAIAVAAGLLHGWLNGAGIAAAGRGAFALAGIVAAVLALLALVSAAASRIGAPWARIAVRVAGSWIAAIGLLLLGWALGGRF